LLKVDEARRRILAMTPALEPEAVGLAEAAGRVLATAMVAGRDLPGFANSAMDGYAVRALDLAGASPENPARLALAGEVGAGTVFAGEVRPGTTVRIMTGAPVPAGADAVVELEEAGQSGSEVLLRLAAEQGRNIRGAGTDVRTGEHALGPGVFLGPAQLALLAALGEDRVECFRRPVVAVVSTGDEVVDAGHDIGPGQVYDAIGPSLAAALALAGARPAMVRRAQDNAGDIRRALTDAAAADLVLSVGGVSMGRYDLVRPAVEELGRLDFWQVAMRPGKPLAVGEVLGRPFVGLPGNPVSALVGFEVFVLPALLAMGGRAGWRRPSVEAELAAPLQTPPGLRTFARARLEARPGAVPLAHPAPGQASYQVRWLAQSNALLDIAEETADLEAGQAVTAILVDQAPGPPL
jgi:molybdopterin molybdotransferase